MIVSWLVHNILELVLRPFFHVFHKKAVTLRFVYIILGDCLHSKAHHHHHHHHNNNNNNNNSNQPNQACPSTPNPVATCSFLNWANILDILLVVALTVRPWKLPFLLKKKAYFQGA